MKISFIGAGNVATHLSRALTLAGHEIIGVHTRTLESSEVFAQKYHCVIARTLNELPDSDGYIFSIKDDALPGVISAFGELDRNGWCLHTAGSVPMSVFENHVKEYGVLYPMQTFSKKRKLDFSKIPLFFEGNTEKSTRMVENLAHEISEEVYPLSSESRKLLHLAAVFASNFSNHCYAIAGNILAQANLPEHLLIPLISETCNKLNELPAVEGQTGPAVRYDQKVMTAQMELLGDDSLRKDIYELMSKSIHEYAEKKRQSSKK